MPASKQLLPGIGLHVHRPGLLQTARSSDALAAGRPFTTASEASRSPAAHLAAASSSARARVAPSPGGTTTRRLGDTRHVHTCKSLRTSENRHLDARTLSCAVEVQACETQCAD